MIPILGHLCVDIVYEHDPDWDIYLPKQTDR